MHNYLVIFDAPASSTNVPKHELKSLLELKAGLGLVKESSLGSNTVFYRDKKAHKIDGSTDTIEELNGYGGNGCVIYPFEQSCIVSSNKPIDFREIVRDSGYIYYSGELVLGGRWDNFSKEGIEQIIFEETRQANTEVRFWTRGSQLPAPFDLRRSVYIQCPDGKYHGSPMARYFAESFSKDQMLRVYFLKNQMLSLFSDGGKVTKDFKLRADHPLISLGIDENRYFIGNTPFLYEKDDLTKSVHEYVSFDKIENSLNFLKDVHHAESKTTLYPESRDSILMLAFSSPIRKINPVQDLDEYKPYWKGKCTTPQRLMAAMLNMVGLRKGGAYLDFFGGTGSSMIEATKVRPAAAIHCDIEELIGAHDNFRFLTLDSSGILGILYRIESLQDWENPDFNFVMKRIRLGHKKGYPEPEPIEKVMREDTSGKLSKFIERLAFYIARRQIQSNITYFHDPDLRRGPVGPSAEYLSNLEKETQKYLALKRLIEDYGTEWKAGGVTYVVSLPRRDGNWLSTKFDVSKGLGIKSDSIDGIVTDPPYGYATANDSNELVELYQKSIRESMRVLKSGGRMALCVLDKVRTGKPVNEQLTTKGVVDIIEKAAAENDVSFSFNELRGADALMYWKARHTLNRGVISFRIFKE